MLLLHVALRDGDEAGEARLRCKQVVEGVVGDTRRDVEADAEDLALFVEEEGEVALTAVAASSIAVTSEGGPVAEAPSSMSAVS